MKDYGLIREAYCQVDKLLTIFIDEAVSQNNYSKYLKNIDYFASTNTPILSLFGDSLNH